MTYGCPHCKRSIQHIAEPSCVCCGCKMEEIKKTEDPRTVIEVLLSAMDMQEKREAEEFHIPQQSAWKIWLEAKEQAQQYLDQIEVVDK